MADSISNSKIAITGRGVSKGNQVRLKVLNDVNADSQKIKVVRSDFSYASDGDYWNDSGLTEYKTDFNDVKFYAEGDRLYAYDIQDHNHKTGIFEFGQKETDNNHTIYRVTESGEEDITDQVRSLFNAEYGQYKQHGVDYDNPALEIK